MSKPKPVNLNRQRMQAAAAAQAEESAPKAPVAKPAVTTIRSKAAKAPAADDILWADQADDEAYLGSMTAEEAKKLREDSLAPSRFENLGGRGSQPAPSDTRNFSGLGTESRPARGGGGQRGGTGASPDGYRRRGSSGGEGRGGGGGQGGSPFGSTGGRRGSGAGYDRQGSSQQGWSRPLGTSAPAPSSSGSRPTGRVTTRISPALPPVKSPPLPASGPASEAWAGDGKGAPIQHRPWKLTEAAQPAPAAAAAPAEPHRAAPSGGNMTSMQRLKAMRESELAKSGRSDQREPAPQHAARRGGADPPSNRSPVLSAVTGIVARPDEIRQRDANAERRAPPNTLYNPSTGKFEDAPPASKPKGGKGGGVVTIRARKYDFKAEEAAREALEAHKARRSAAEREAAEAEARKAAAAAAAAPKPAWGGAAATRAAAPKAALGERPKKAPVPTEQRVASLQAARAANLGGARQAPAPAPAPAVHTRSPVYAAAAPSDGSGSPPSAHRSQAAREAAKAAARHARAVARLLRRPRTNGLRYVQVLRRGKLQYMDYDEWYNTDSTGWPKEAASAKERARAQVEAAEAAAAAPPSPVHPPVSVPQGGVADAPPSSGGEGGVVGDEEDLALGGAALAPRTHSSGWDLDDGPAAPAQQGAGAHGAAHASPAATSHNTASPAAMPLANLPAAAADASAVQSQAPPAQPSAVSEHSSGAEMATLGSLGAVGRTVALSNGQVVQARQVTTQDGQVAVLMVPVSPGSAAAAMPGSAAMTAVSSPGLLGGGPAAHMGGGVSAPMYAGQQLGAGMPTGQDMYASAGYGAGSMGINPAAGALWGGAGGMPGMDMWGGGMPAAQWGGMPQWGMNPAMYGPMGMMGAYMQPQGLGMMPPGGAHLGMGGVPVSSAPHVASPHMGATSAPQAYGGEGLLPPPASAGGMPKHGQHSRFQ